MLSFSSLVASSRCLLLHCGRCSPQSRCLKWRWGRRRRTTTTWTRRTPTPARRATMTLRERAIRFKNDIIFSLCPCLVFVGLLDKLCFLQWYRGLRVGTSQSHVGNLCRQRSFLCILFVYEACLDVGLIFICVYQIREEVFRAKIDWALWNGAR